MTSAGFTSHSCDTEKPRNPCTLPTAIGGVPGIVSVSSGAGRGFTPGPQRDSVPSVLEAQKHGVQAGSWSSRMQRARLDLAGRNCGAEEPCRLAACRKRTLRDVKNEDRSGHVHENKGDDDKMSDEIHAIYTRKARITLESTIILRALRPKMHHLHDNSGQRRARIDSSAHFPIDPSEEHKEMLKNEDCSLWFVENKGA